MSGKATNHIACHFAVAPSINGIVLLRNRPLPLDVKKHISAYSIILDIKE